MPAVPLLAAALLLGHAIWPAAASLTRHEVFLTWARQQGLRLGPVCIVPSTLGGVGVFAERDIALGEMVFAVPKRLHVGLKAALADPSCGAEFESRVEDGNALGVLCAFLAKEALCSDGAFKPYIDTLDLTVANPDYVQFWTEEEVDLLSGTAAYQIALDVRAEAEDVVRFALSLDSLRRCVHQDLSARGVPMDAAVVEERIATCVRRAHAAVLSRSFDDLSDFGAREMIPLLDVLQHGKPPSVQHRTKGSVDFEQPVDWTEWADEDGRDEWEEAALSEPCLVARTRSPVAAGELIFFDDHPECLPDDLSECVLIASLIRRGATQLLWRPPTFCVCDALRICAKDRCACRRACRRAPNGDVRPEPRGRRGEDGQDDGPRHRLGRAVACARAFGRLDA
jgi:hypothetical protein